MRNRSRLLVILLLLCQGAHAGGITLIVDPGDFPDSLNAAIQTGNASNGPVAIEFPSGTFSFDSITSSPTPIMQGDITLMPQGKGLVIIDGNGFTGRGFEVGGGGTVTFDSLTIQDFDGPGIMIQGSSTVNIINSTISGNNNFEDGGGIFNSGNLTINDSTILGNSSRNGGGIFSDSDSLTIQNSIIRGNNASENGGGLFIRTGPGSDHIDHTYVTVDDNQAGINGGGMSFDLDDTSGADQIVFDDLVITNNQAGNNGGGIDVLGGGGNDDFRIRNCRFEGNQSTVFGEDLNINSPDGGPGLLLQGCSLIGPNPRTRVENPAGEFEILDSLVESGGPNGIDNTGTVAFGGTVFERELADLVPFDSSKAPPARDKALCNDFGVGVFQSLGHNISPDNTCNLNQASDMPNTDAMVGRDSSGKIGLLPGSPAIDAGLAAISVRLPALGPMLPCGYKDANGLGRPQDGNGDGVFECDIGAIEMQGGPDIVAAQSSAYFDAGRDGEGVFVELIGNNLAVVTMFTYSVDGNLPTWFLGVGNVVGNSVVVDNMSEFDGGVFGAGFDAANISSTVAGSLSLNFPTCESVSKPGKMAFQANPMGHFSDLLVNASRLSTIVDCNAVNKGASVAGRSGAFFDPARNGEGIFTQWLTNGSVVVIWYTYDSQGNRLWIINDAARTTVSGNKVTATMLFPSSTTSFGAGFDPSEVVLSDWGTVTLDYQAGCNALTFGYNSSVSGFGAGSFNYVRLTTLSGTSCDL